MEPDSVARELRTEFETRLEKVQDRLLTAVFGFVNGASARMERLENVDHLLQAEMAKLERRIRALERHTSKPTGKNSK